jgi:hypothetical protein
VAAVERAAASVPVEVRTTVSRWVGDWTGEPPGISREWLTKSVADLPREHRTAARLALTVAAAPYQAEDEMRAFRRDHPEDRDLVVLCGWAALTAARRTATWIWAAGR